MATIKDLAEQCAADTWEQRTILEDGSVLVARSPQLGDWDALEDMLGRRWTDDEGVEFSRSFGAGIDALGAGETFA